MPRKSLDAQTTLHAGKRETPHTLLPSEALPEGARRAFSEIVDSVANGHFSTADRPTLEALAMAVYTSRAIAALLDRDGVTVGGVVNPAVAKLNRQLALVGQLSSRLRLTPQNRISKDKAGTTTAGGKPSIREIYQRAMEQH